MNEETKLQIEYVRLSKGVTRAAATNWLAAGGKLDADWKERLPALQEQAAKALEALRAAERTPKRDRQLAEQAAGQASSQPGPTT